MKKNSRIIKVGSGKIHGFTVKTENKVTVKKRQSQEVCPRQDKLKYAEHLKKNATQSELILKEAMLQRGYKFEFQAVVYGYIPDFYFPDRKWIVELDGKKFHDAERDRKRDKVFLKFGIRTLRIRSYRVFSDLPVVLKFIADAVYGARWNAKFPKRRKKRRKRIRRWQDVPNVLDDEFRFYTEGL